MLHRRLGSLRACQGCQDVGRRVGTKFWDPVIWRGPGPGMLSRASFSVRTAWSGRGQDGGVCAGMPTCLFARQSGAAPLLTGFPGQFDS